MTWEKRRKKTYYYRKIRTGDRVTSQYLKAGPDLDHHLQNQRRDQAEQQLLHTLTALEADLDQLYTLIQALHETSLLLSGYHTHKGQ
jgi:hypothetical protein